MSTTTPKPATTPIPVQLSAMEFTAFLLPCLSMPKRGPKCTLGYYRVFHLIVWALYTGMQWKCLPIPHDTDGTPTIHDTTVSRVFATWADEGRCGRRLSSVCGLWLVVGALAGCAALQAHEQQRWQALADQVTTHFGVDAVAIRLASGSRGEYNCETHALELGTLGNPRWLLAHELGHHLSGFCGGTLASEMVANRWAVQVLQVWGDSESQAARATVLHLLSLKRLRGDQQLIGHHYCAEAADILRYYPRQRDPRDPGDHTCGAELTGW